MAKVVREESDHKVIMVEEGDSLWSIAKEFFNDPTRWGEIESFVGLATVKHAFVRAGMELRVPKTEGK